MLLRFHFAKISFAVEIYWDGWLWRTAPSPLKSLIAFCCGAWWDKSKRAYNFSSKDSLLHFAFLTGDLDKLYFLQMLDGYRFENQLRNCQISMSDDIPF